MRTDILEIIAGSRNLTDVVILTYNIDLMFVQSMLLPRLKKCGHPSLTIFADATRACETFNSQRDFLFGLGKRYRLVPVTMRGGFSFHPKVVLLRSDKRATLLVGSGNLSFGGWRENGESWLRFDNDVETSAPLASLYTYLKHIIRLVPVSQSIEAKLKSVFESNKAFSPNDVSEVSVLLYKPGNAQSLIDMILGQIDLSGVRQVTICAPFFDAEGEMIRQIHRKTGSPNTRVLIQCKKTNLTNKAIELMPENIEFVPVTFKHQDERESFLHSKFYAFEKDDSVNVAIGSANCSMAALGIPEGGNAELIALATMSRDDFQNHLIDELHFVGGSLTLQNAIPEKADETSDAPQIRILAARQFGLDLRVVFDIASGYRLLSCFVDEKPVEFRFTGKEEISVSAVRGAEVIILEADNGKMRIRSLPCWIDDEYELQKTAGDRNLASTISSKVQSSDWNIKSWADILSVLQKNLEYMKAKELRFTRIKRAGEADNTAKRFTANDIFTDGYCLPSANHIHAPRDEHGRLMGLQQLLLHWFGIGWKSDQDELSDKAQLKDEPEEENDDIVDRPEDFPVPKMQKQKHLPTEREKRRGRKLVKKIADRLTNANFLYERPPDQLGMDIAIVGIVLCSGLYEGWLDLKEFLNVTYKIWSALFFESTDEDSHGYIELLQQKAANSSDFADDMASVELASVLAMWSLSTYREYCSRETAIFSLACTTCIARLSWLWSLNDLDELTASLKRHMLNIRMLLPYEPDKWEDMRKWLLLMFRRGLALKNLFTFFEERGMEYLRQRVRRAKIKKGEILWQGKKYGFCILGEDCNRNECGGTDVFSLTKPGEKKQFAKDYIVPIADFVFPSAEYASSDKEQKVVEEFLKEIENGFRRP